MPPLTPGLRRVCVIALLLVATVFAAAWVWSMRLGCDLGRRQMDATPGTAQHVTVLQHWWSAMTRGRFMIAYERERLTVPAATRPIPPGGFSASALHHHYWRFEVRPSDSYSTRFDSPRSLSSLGIDWRLNGATNLSPPAGGTRSGYYHILSIPHWLPIVAALIGAWRLAARGRRRRGASDGLSCRRCGYDVRATPDRCPECGLQQPAYGDTDAAASP